MFTWKENHITSNYFLPEVSRNESKHSSGPAIQHLLFERCER